MMPVDGNGDNGNGEGWLALAGSGIMRPVVRALQNAGVIEAKNEGYLGKLIGQYYRVTPAGRDALASREDEGQ
jgi:DNA-binding PadR family transcriptional regulator